MNWPRKCLAALILALIMMPAWYSIQFLIREQIIEYKMWNSIEKEASDVIVIHPSKLYWMEEGREIFVNGLMFDVKSIEKIGDSLRIIGEYDYEESGLHKEHKRIKESREKENNPSHSVRVLVQVMDDSIFRITPILFLSDHLNRERLPGETTLPIIYLGTLSPPPKA